MSKNISDIRGSQLPKASAAPRTFVDTVQAMPVSVPTRKADVVYCVEIFPVTTNARCTSGGTTEKLLRSIKPCEFGFQSVRLKRNPRSVLMESTSSNVVKLVGAAPLAEDGLRDAEIKKRVFLLSILGVARAMKKGDVVNPLKTQNDVEWKDQSRVRPV